VLSSRAWRCRFKDCATEIMKDKSYEEISQYDTRPDWCPLLPLPEGHGDLIDRDALIKEIDDRSMSDSDWWYEDRIEEMPPIVPAEGGGE